ncbi:MAG: hypothetical protein WCV73_02880 [Patescibacteria group bacterium]|jgi:hypothetical protein
MFKRTKWTIDVILLLFLGLIILWLYLADFGKKQSAVFGITFSQKYATSLNLDWRKVLTGLLDELGVRQFRVVAYWDLLEQQPNNYDFTDLDWQISQIEQRGGQVVLAMGNRVPRWPECHWPSWAYQYNEVDRQNQILTLLNTIVSRYQTRPGIIAWQVENEPFLKIFGECPKSDLSFYKKEIALIKSLDARPVIITESGELSTWLRGGKWSDWLGVSVYRITWNKLFGYFYYPLPPAYYYLKGELVKFITGVDKVFVSEMQMEPWLSMPILNVPLSDQMHSMNLDKFKNNLAYIKRTGLSPVYLWGAEWWYWLREQGDSSIWNEALDIWKQF